MAGGEWMGELLDQKGSGAWLCSPSCALLLLIMSWIFLWAEELAEGSEQRKDLIRLRFYKDHSGCCVKIICS